MSRENKEKKEKKEPRARILVRVICLVLAVSMVASTFLYVLYYLFA